MKRSLTLSRETLAELTAGELTSVVGGEVRDSLVASCPLRDCVDNVTRRVSCYCPTLFC